MSGLRVGVTEVASLENGLAATLTETSQQVARSECLDDEQRAEVYTILEALKTNSRLHQAMVKQLARKYKEAKGNA